MSRLMILAALLALSAPAVAAENQKVEATGEAAIVDGNKALAKDRATEDALRRAVEQACGTLVVSQSETEQFTLINDRILTQAKGYVSSYKVLETSSRDGSVTVRIRAEVGTDKLAGDLAAIGIALARKGMPRLAVLITEQRIGELKPAAWWGAHAGEEASAGALKISQRLTENALLDAWTKKGFPFVDLEALAGKLVQKGIVSSDLDKDQLREAGALTGADVIITGSAIATEQAKLKDVLEGVDPHAKSASGVSCTATVTARAVSPDSGEVLATATAQAKAFNLSADGCGRDAIVKAVAQFSPELQKNLLAAWERQSGGGARVQLKVSSVDSLKVLNAFRNALKTAVRGVRSVDQKAFGKGKADLDVRVEGAVEDFGAELDGKVIGGRTVKVTAMSANVIELELAR